jgi:hypothetical protein
MTYKIDVQCSSFKVIREVNLFYADKTEYIYHLIKDHKAKIICRPFGFGKTLLIDTLETLFSGDREAFAGLWIDRSDYQFVKHPIVRVNLGFKDSMDADELKTRISNELLKIARDEALPINGLNPHLPFEDLVFSLYRKYNPASAESDSKWPSVDPDHAKVVVLIDDFDAPIINSVYEPDVVPGVQKTLAGFFRSIQRLAKYCRFILLTGQTMLGADLEASDFNRETDVSYQSEYAAICGFTMEETERLMADQFESLAPALIEKNQFRAGQTLADLKNSILLWYDGYVFDATTAFEEKNREKLSIVKVLNPFAILSFFAHQHFDTHWIKAQNDAFLPSVISKKPERFIGDDFSGYSKLTLYRLDKPPMGPLLFQMGYMTLKESFLSHGIMTYSLKVPNLEISLGFRVAILETLFNLTNLEEIQNTQKKVQISLSSHNQVDWEDAFALAVARLTFRPPRPGDFFYRLVFQLFIYCLGFEIGPEDPNVFDRLKLVTEAVVAKKARQAPMPPPDPFLP